MTADEMRRAAELLWKNGEDIETCHTVAGEWLDEDDALRAEVREHYRLAASLRAHADEVARPQEAIDLARLLREEADSQGWRDIATAPRDGTYILGYRANGEIARCRVIPRDDCEMWEFGNTSGAYELYPRIRPTHWRPLPPPPQGREG